LGETARSLRGALDGDLLRRNRLRSNKTAACPLALRFNLRFQFAMIDRLVAQTKQLVFSRKTPAIAGPLARCETLHMELELMLTVRLTWPARILQS
jgi:hypothetical protein